MLTQPGTYRAHPNGFDLGYTKDSKPQIAVQFDILEGNGEPTGSTITWFGYFTDKSRDITFKALRACGWVGDDIDAPDGFGSQDVEIVVEEDTYEGKTQLKVRWVNKPGAGIALQKPMNADERKRFAAEMKGFVLKANGGKPSAPTPAKPPAGNARPAPASDDDLPF